MNELDLMNQHWQCLRPQQQKKSTWTCSKITKVPWCILSRIEEEEESKNFGVWNYQSKQQSGWHLWNVKIRNLHA
jgi:hypothetical protein